MKRFCLAAALILGLLLGLSACAPDGGFMSTSPSTTNYQPARGPYGSGAGGMGY